MAAMLGEGLGAGLDDNTLDMVMAAVGVEAGTLPKQMADVNRVLNSLPPEAREALVIAFINTLYG